MTEPIVSVDEARKLLGEDAVGMSDQEIAEVIDTLDLLAKDAFDKAKRKIRMKKDARELAEIIHSIYKEHRRQGYHNAKPNKKT